MAHRTWFRPPPAPRLLGRTSHQRTQQHLVLLLTAQPRGKRALALAKGSAASVHESASPSHPIDPRMPPTPARPPPAVAAGEPSAMGYDQGLPPHDATWPQRSDYDPYAYARHSAAAASSYYQPPPPGTEHAAPAAAFSSWSSAVGSSNSVIVGGPGAEPLAVPALSQPTGFATSIGWSGGDVGHLPYYDPQYQTAQHPTAVFTDPAYVFLFTVMCVKFHQEGKIPPLFAENYNNNSNL
jgi:hypothetical protein